MAEELKILMIEDLEEDAGLILRVLRKENFNFNYIRVDDREEFINNLNSFDPHIILSDHALPQFNSIEALEICRNQGLNTPFILVTGAVSEEFAVMCLKHGADDYVLKSNLSRLPLAIRNALAQREQQQIRVNQQRELQSQNEELIKINKELDSFVYSISHNLRSPLSSVLGLVNVAKMEGYANPQSMQSYFSLIEKSVLKLDETLKGILDYSRNSRTGMKIDVIDFPSLVNTTLDQLKYMNGFDQVDVKTNLQNDMDFYSDQYRIGILLNNLISNAIKYRDPKKKNQFIHITLSMVDADVLIEIKDNGIGIQSELLPHIFKMFYRATEISEGSGLGLYIVKEIVDKLLGKISIDSTLSIGTTFSIVLPNLKPDGVN